MKLDEWEEEMLSKYDDETKKYIVSTAHVDAVLTSINIGNMLVIIFLCVFIKIGILSIFTAVITILIVITFMLTIRPILGPALKKFYIKCIMIEESWEEYEDEE